MNNRVANCAAATGDMMTRGTATQGTVHRAVQGVDTPSRRWPSAEVFESSALGLTSSRSWRIWWSLPCAAAVWWIAYVTSNPGHRADTQYDLPVHEALRAVAASVPSDAAALLPGFALGDTALVNAELVEAMRASGLAHLTAVSGANCIIPMTVAGQCGAWFGLPWRVRIGLQLCALAIFAAAVWPEPTVLRASLMLGLVLGIRAFGRRAIGVPVLSLVVIGCLLVNPDLAHSLGFALSVAATLGIVILSPALEARCSRWLPSGVAQGLAVTVAAILATFPLFILLGQSTPLIAIPVNVIAAPAALWASWWATLAAALVVWMPGLASLFLGFGVPGAWIVSTLARFGAAHPVMQLPWPESLIGTWLAAAIVVMVMISLWCRPLLARWIRAIAVVATASIVVGTAVWGIAGAARIPADWDVVMCDVGQGDGLIVRLSDGGVAVSDTGPDSEPIVRCLHDLNIRQVDLLALSHFDHDHVGGAVGILDAFAVGSTIIPDAEDARPEARAVLRALAEHNVAVTRLAARSGVQFGKTQLIALSPTPATASSRTPDNASDGGAESTNDAGLVLRWEVPGGCSMVTLADLSEVAQRPLVDEVSPINVVKVAHHGSKDFSPALVEALRPSVALIGVGKNSYGHPTPQAIGAWRLAGADVRRTDRDGNIAVSCGADKIEVVTTK